MTNDLRPPRLVALYLPQFHRIPENDKWWGEGFTEWTNVRAAQPLFSGHRQPRIPMKGNYYDLLEKETMAWQCNLAKDHGIDAFCFYHYWFGGQLLLEKPVENYLRWTELPMGFFLSWANEPWARTWDGKDKEVLMPQVYGGEEEWRKHLEYLIPFFKDSRYQKVDGRPVFVLYRSSSIPECKEMISFWDEGLKAEGFSGIHIIETLNGFQRTPCLDASRGVMPMEPTFTMRWDDPLGDKILRKIRRVLQYKKGPRLISYDATWKQILRRRIPRDGKDWNPCVFLDWDNSPRKKLKSAVFQGATPEKFEAYAKSVYKRAVANGSNFVFINAWNEWAEGTHLEPEEYHGLSYLHATRRFKE